MTDEVSAAPFVAVERVRPLGDDWMVVVDKTPHGSSLNDVAFYAKWLVKVDD